MTSTTATAVRYQMRDRRERVTPLTLDELRDQMQLHGLRFSELRDHIEDVDHGHAVWAENGTRFELAPGTLHAHVHTDATDCDGRIERTYVLDLVDDEEEYDFQARVLASVVNVTPAYGGRLDVEHVEDGLTRLLWAEGTDEGRRHVEATFCRSVVCDQRSTQRDHAAEAMGY